MTAARLNKKNVIVQDSTKVCHPEAISRRISHECASRINREILRGVYPERSRRAQNDRFLTTPERSQKSGFTLVELLVVISIIAVLSVIGMAVFTGVSKGARDARRREDVDAIAKALEATKVNGEYRPLTDSDFALGSKPHDPTYPTCTTSGSFFIEVFAAGGCASNQSGGVWGYILCLRDADLDPTTDNYSCKGTKSLYYYICTRLETNTGNFYNTYFNATAGTVGPTYCRKNQQ